MVTCYFLKYITLFHHSWLKRLSLFGYIRIHGARHFMSFMVCYFGTHFIWMHTGRPVDVDNIYRFIDSGLI
jgi:hypothetical protein